MDGAELQRIAAETALALPATEETEPFGPEVSVFKVREKMFMMTAEHEGRPIVTLKCEPEYSEALRQEHSAITPGYHMNKRHWITLTDGPGVTGALVAELVTNAYALVVEKLPRHARPLVPQAGRARANGT
ncbi:MmcQ/YjbR family DNA-binding protein [Phaeacidiphilus oryzae]|uniref:MmcQ/YjbR family DNA-binding protein n=1 Tax=Phaeacidiphilus oryzae TaxID=348818 RepID=UPI000569329B|nr:MmcQ/YjbR family DNA-binding protein [Phaeacidiphilus oryzae]